MEFVYRDGTSFTRRIRVPGGWIYETHAYSSVTTLFIPDRFALSEADE